MNPPATEPTDAIAPLASNDGPAPAVAVSDQSKSKSTPEEPPLLRDKSFLGMAATQFLGAFNDNLFKQLILLLATPTAVELAAKTAGDRQSTAMAVFALPFLLFSGIAGFISDRVSKRSIVVGAKFAELALYLPYAHPSASGGLARLPDHGLLHSLPSRSRSASASSGPQVPA